MPGDALIQSIIHADDILKLLSESNRPLPIPDICSALNLRHPTAFNMLRSLVSVGLVQRVKTGKLITYMLGKAIDDFAVSRRHTQINVWLDQMLPLILSKLEADQVSFAVFMEDAFYVIRRINADQSVESPDHWMTHPYASAASLVLAAYLSVHQLAAMHATIPFERYGLEAWSSQEDYMATLDSVRGNGFAVIGNPIDKEPVDIALPAFGPAGEILGAISVHWQSYPAAKSPQCYADTVKSLLEPLP